MGLWITKSTKHDFGTWHSTMVQASNVVMVQLHVEAPKPFKDSTIMAQLQAFYGSEDQNKGLQFLQQIKKHCIPIVSL